MRSRYWLFALVVLASCVAAAKLRKPQPPAQAPPTDYRDRPPQFVAPSPTPPLARELATMEAAGGVVPQTAGAPQLPVAQAVLFSSGVGYFQREGTVDGNARVDLSFPVRDVNDLLKSMIVRDLDGGHIGSVSYDSNAPVEKTLNSFALNLTGNPSLAAILNQARGEKVEAVAVAGACLGTVVGVETKREQAGKDAFVDVEVLNLWCADGLRSLKMSELQRVRFLNPIMESEFRKALETLALSHDTQKKAVSINFVGEGKRNVRVGYVVENPVWKTSYRLVLPSAKADRLASDDKCYFIVIVDDGGQGERVFRLPFTDNETVLDAVAKIGGLSEVSSMKDMWLSRMDPSDTAHPKTLPIDWRGITEMGWAKTNWQLFPADRIFIKVDNLSAEKLRGVKLRGPDMVKSTTEEKTAKPYLQGWAVVENTSDEDWKDVRVSLVSGRPISFEMDLYQPLFVPRPTVTPELFASLQPRVYNGRIDQDAKILNDYEGMTGRTARIEKNRVFDESVDDAETVPSGVAYDRRGWDKLRRGRPPIGLSNATGGLVADKRLALDNGMTPVAQATKLGDNFHYVIQHPVTLARQKSAMLPIVGKDIEAKRVSIYNEATLAQHPLLGVRLKNTTGMHLMQGPITVFEDGTYAGDARILDLVPNEERLVSYAIDLGTEVKASWDDGSNRITFLKLTKGLLSSKTVHRRTKTYRVKNSSETERTVIIEHPAGDDFTLVGKDKPTERTRDAYRFELKVPAGKTAAVDAVEERVVASTFEMTSLDERVIRIFINTPATNAKLREALQRAIELREAQAKTQREVGDTDVQLRAITDDQARLRANLKEMPSTAAAYKRYLEKFDQQETQLEKLQAAIKELQAKEAEHRAAYETYLMNLDVESAVPE